MDTLAPEQVRATVLARTAAVGWLNAFSAAGADADRPMLSRTLSIEFFRYGIQMIGCDGSALFRTWAPMVELEGQILGRWPEPDESPSRSVVVMDPDSFGLGFMRALVRVTGEDTHAYEELQLTITPHDDEATIALGSEFMTERLTLRACGQRIDLRLYEGVYPDWRALNLGIEAERVEGMSLAPRLLALLGKLKGATAMDLEFFGTERRIEFVALGEFETRGLVMPMRRREG